MKIICLIGKACSGKDTIAKMLTAYKQIDIGSIVRELTKTKERVHNQTLDKAIIEELYRCIHKLEEGNVVITGIRQLTILKAITNVFTNTEVIWLEASDEVLKNRFIKRAAEKDKNITFEEVLKKDNELGLKDIETYVRLNSDRVTIIETN